VSHLQIATLVHGKLEAHTTISCPTLGAAVGNIEPAAYPTTSALLRRSSRLMSPTFEYGRVLCWTNKSNLMRCASVSSCARTGGYYSGQMGKASLHLYTRRQWFSERKTNIDVEQGQVTARRSRMYVVRILEWTMLQRVPHFVDINGALSRF
jgi:hypothetical protein